MGSRAEEKRRLHDTVEVVGSCSAEERDAELRAQAINVDTTDVDAQAASAFASSAGASSSGVARSPRARRQRQQDSEEDGTVNPGKRARVKMEPDSEREFIGPPTKDSFKGDVNHTLTCMNF